MEEHEHGCLKQGVIPVFNYIDLSSLGRPPRSAL